MWATSLPCDLLLDIFRRVGFTAVIRCAGVCRPWQHAIIDNATCLRPRHDRFLPELLLALLDTYWHLRQETILGRLDYVPVGPSANNLLVDGFVDVSLYGTPLASRNGFLLLGGINNLCLCNPLTGSFNFVSTAPLGDSSSEQCTYVLATGYDDDSQPDGGAVGKENIMRTERTWRTELPEECEMSRYPASALVLATSEDERRLPLIASQVFRHQIKVWMLVGDSRSILQQTMDLQRWLLPNCRSLTYILLGGFRPRSGCLFSIVRNDRGLYKKFVVAVDESSPRSRLQILLQLAVRDGLVNVLIKDEVFLASIVYLYIRLLNFNYMEVIGKQKLC